MKRTLSTIFAAALVYCSVQAQKPPLDHSVYDGWQTIGSTIVSSDGKWVSYQINPQQGDGTLCLYSTASMKIDSIARGTKLAFSPQGTYAAYQINPSYAETRAAKKKKLKDDKMPKSSLEIRLLSTGGKITVPRVKSFQVAEKNSEWMAYLLEKRTEEKKDTASKSSPANSKAPAKAAKKPEPKGTELVILNPVTKKEYRYQDVTDYNVTKDGKAITFLQDIPDTTKIEKFVVQYFDTQKESVKPVFEGKGTVKKLTTNDQGNLVTFLFTTDTAKLKVYDLWCSKNIGTATKIVDSSNPALPKKWGVSENGNISYSDDGTRIYFGTARKPVKDPVDTLLDEEKYKMDLWSWDDDLLQPMQKKQLDQELKRTYVAVYHLDRNIMFQMSDTTVPDLRIPRKGNRDLALATSDLKYRKLSSWDDKNYTDYYLVNFENGSRKLLIENTPDNIILSPTENYFLFYSYDKKGWYSQPVQGGEVKCISSGIEFPLFDELNDTPSEPRPYGLAGWADDSKHVYVYDRFDIWSLDLTGVEKPVNLTNGYGRRNNLVLRYVKLDPEADFISRKELIYLSAFNYLTKEAGFYTLKQTKQAEPTKLLMEKAAFARDITKPKDVDILYFTKESFNAAPDLYISDMLLQNVKKISSINPQQKKYNWLTAELVQWHSFDNTELQGILYKPEDFDPSRKYPMIVYFYERSSDGLYSYFPPSPSASIINRSFAASNGYLLFVPDIPYNIGYPGQSCYNAVISGTNALLERYSYIDRNRLALDGQSWGGYQIAWLVTQTDLFKCAYAGAAVVNMISAYGGIRWETGMSREFQYEHTQSRIGGTLWDKPIQFIENSPIFFVPKINTPLLLMNNDADGAVPWYQGIEFITALRRLNKPAWMLSYNDEAHNLVKRPNRKDISIRKMQFFDYYLKDAPMPYWMKYGIDQTQKGKVNGYELINE